MFCMNCGQQLPDTAKFCIQCGANVGGADIVPERYVQQMQHQPQLRCPKCNGINIDIQTMQEDLGSVSHDASKTKYRSHYVQRNAIVKKNRGITTTSNRVTYRTLYTCLDCGNVWSKYAVGGNSYGYSVPGT